MKKTFKLLFAVVLLVFGLFVVVSCDSNPTEDDNDKNIYTVVFDSNGGSKVEEQKVKEGEFAKKPENPTKENYVFTAWYSDKALSKEYDFATPVKENLKLYAGWSEEGETKQILVSSVSKNNNLLAFESNKEEKANKRSEFMDRTLNLLVGTDNPFVVKPSVSFVEYDPQTEDFSSITVTEWEYNVTVYVKDDLGNYANAGEDLVEAIDTVNATVDFQLAAAGKEFKVVVMPKGLTPKQLETPDRYSVSLEVEVVEGYNVYSALDLAYAENRASNIDGSVNLMQDWIDFKTAKGLKLDYHPAALILQKNISITVDDIPSSFVYHESDLSQSDSDYARTLGSLRDNYFVYVRDFAADEKFDILGNYFTLSAEQLPIVTREYGDITREGEVISHSTLFYYHGDNSGVGSMKNLNLIGNAPRVENNIKAGGIILHKDNGVKYTAYNNIAVCWFISYMPDGTQVEYEINSCRCYNNFNSFIYNWGCPKLTVNDSEMIGAGGPVIIQDHIHVSDPDGGIPGSTIFTNCNVESHVVGTEGWFTVVGAAALVPQIKALNALFTPFGWSFLDSNSDGSLTYLNLISVIKSGSAQSVTKEKVKGTIGLNGHVFDYGETGNPYLAAMLNTTFDRGAPGFETDTAALNSGIAYGTDTGLFDVTNTQIMDPTNGIFSGNYLAMYYNGMMFVLGYGAAGRIYTA